jgi:hypothetical protein
MKRCDSLRTVTAGFLVVHPPLPPVASVFVSPLRPDADLGPGALVAATPMPLVKWSRRASQVPGEPSCAYAMFLDPGGIGTTRPYSGPTRPPIRQSRRLPAGEAISGLNSTASALTVYASQWPLLTPTQDSLPAAG